MIHSDTGVAYFEHAALMRFGSAVVAEIKAHPNSREIAMGLANHMKRIGEPPIGLDLGTTITWFSAMLTDFDRSFAAGVRSRFIV
ncbi:hypothetical protein CCP3SC15_310018 [Gammaproteobacteria bacterium]